MEAIWTPEKRITVARNAAAVLHSESSSVIMSRRVHDLSEIILYALTMPGSFLTANRNKFAEFE